MILNSKDERCYFLRTKLTTSIFWKASSNKLNGNICKVFNNKDTFYIIQTRSIDCKHIK